MLYELFQRTHGVLALFVSQYYCAARRDVLAWPNYSRLVHRFIDSERAVLKVDVVVVQREQFSYA
jgi:hypothetical protein